jgi:transcription-repair coupling factor (superfamily II helicase)
MRGRAAAEGEARPVGGEAGERPGWEPVRVEVDVDAYVPADYIPFEAAKIDVHRRVAAAREPGELRALREELEDRFGEPPQPVTNLIDLQRGRIALGDAGARSVEFRAGRLRVAPVELDSSQVEALREALPEVIYEWRERTVVVPVPDEPGARLGAVSALADGLGAARAVPAAA